MRNAARLRFERAGTFTTAELGRAATRALYDELVLSPKPGLVTLTDRGSHSDMDAQMFMRSLFSLRHYFSQIAQAGHDGADFAGLERLGIEAEVRMLAATGGVNTHRGAIFMLGLLCASAGAVLRESGSLAQPNEIRESLQRNWGAALEKRCGRVSSLPGGMAAHRYGLRSASQEAALGFPVLFETAVPALTAALARGLSPQQARLDTLFHIMAVLDDSNLAHRGGIAGLYFGQASAQQFIQEGGAGAIDGIRKVEAIAREFVARRLSPGGAADTLSAACWLVRLHMRP
ncbi:triphosphoribosyl-dephospho-CoA synthase MdcB [Burkholderiaceae bacterium UC74_6]